MVHMKIYGKISNIYLQSWTGFKYFLINVSKCFWSKCLTLISNSHESIKQLNSKIFQGKILGIYNTYILAVHSISVYSEAPILKIWKEFNIQAMLWYNIFIYKDVSMTKDTNHRPMHKWSQGMESELWTTTITNRTFIAIIF